MSTGEVYHMAGLRSGVQNVVTPGQRMLLQAPRQGLASGPAEDDGMHQLDHVPVTLDEAIGLLRATLDGTVVTPTDSGYDIARGAGPTAAARPAVIVLASGVDDIVHAVRFARAQRLPVAIRSLGQRAAAAADGAILIDASAIGEVAIDPACCTATVGAGATWADVVAEASRYGLAPVLGEWSHRSAVSDTLSGGLGWLARRHGLASDSVVGFQLVTPDGLMVEVTADAHPELFWALSGAGDGSLGVVASIEIELHPLGPVYAGALAYPIDGAADVLGRWRAWVTGARPELTSSVVLASDTISVLGCWSGAIGVGHSLVDEWRQWRAPDVDTWADRALADVDAINEHRLSPASTTMTNEWANTLRDELLDELVAIARARRHGRRCRGDPPRRRRGTVAQRGGGQRPWTLRSVLGDAGRARRRSGRAPPTPGAVDHGCRLSRPHRRRRACRPHRAAFGSEQWSRLCAVKAALDPSNRFRHGLVIEPDAAPAD